MPCITDRDRAILWSLGTARVLSAQELEWLHFPGWEERERAQREHFPAEPLRRPANVHRRIRSLQNMGFIHSVVRLRITTAGHGARAPFLHCLTQAGKEHLAETMECDVAELWAYPAKQHRSVDNLEHSYLIGRAYAALAAGSAREGHALTMWAGDHLLAKDYDRLVVASHPEKLPVLPDATGVLLTNAVPRRFFVEVDRGTMAADRWREKIAAQHAYQGSAPLQARYGTGAFFTCIVAPTQTRLRRIAEAVARVTREPGYTFLFATLDQLHPTTIRGCWQRISAIRWETRPSAAGAVEWPVLTFAPLGLWKASAQPAINPPTNPATNPIS